MITRPTWTRTSRHTWKAEGIGYAVCMNDTGRSFRLMKVRPDGYLDAMRTAQRFRTLEGAQNMAEAFQADIDRNRRA